MKSILGIRIDVQLAAKLLEESQNNNLTITEYVTKIIEERNNKNVDLKLNISLVSELVKESQEKNLNITEYIVQIIEERNGDKINE